MQLKNLKVAVFEHTDADVLQADLNAWTSGQAISTAATFAAGFVKEQQFLAVHYQYDGTSHTALVAYTE